MTQPMYWVRRGAKIRGPLTASQVRAGLSAGKLAGTDEIGLTNAGPWRPVGQPACPPTAVDASVRKTFFGGYVVNYLCPRCSVSLQSPFKQFKETDNCPECKTVFSLPDEIVARVRLHNEEVGRKAAVAEAERQQRQAIARAAKEERDKQRREREAEQEASLGEQRRQEEQQAVQRAAYREEYLARRSQLPEAAQLWLREAEQEEYWVRKDFYHLRAYVEAYCADGLECHRAGEALVQEADAHNNFKGACRNCWYALFLMAEATYGESPQARLAFEKTQTTDIWDGMSCYALEGLYFLLADNYPEHATAAANEYEQRRRHDAWLCSIYYTLRAIIVLRTGPLAEHPRYADYFHRIESEYDVWQALVSRTIELFVEVDVFQREAR